jgi:hypothetical protein
MKDFQPNIKKIRDVQLHFNSSIRFSTSMRDRKGGLRDYWAGREALSDKLIGCEILNLNSAGFLVGACLKSLSGVSPCVSFLLALS